MLLVNDLMTINPYRISPHANAATARSLMGEEEIRQLPVIEDGTLVGIITERDLRLQPDAQPRTAVTVEMLMTPTPITVSPDTPAYKAAEMLRTFKFGALPVVDAGRLVGIVTTSDFLRYVVRTTMPAMAPMQVLSA